jgi:hypothetical protein
MLDNASWRVNSHSSDSAIFSNFDVAWVNWKGLPKRFTLLFPGNAHIITCRKLGNMLQNVLISKQAERNRVVIFSTWFARYG